MNWIFQNVGLVGINRLDELKIELFKLLSTAKQDEQGDAVKFAVIFILNRYLTSMIKISRMRKVIIL